MSELRNNVIFQSKLEVFKSSLISPKLPLQQVSPGFKGFRFEYYDYNGWVYELPAGKYKLILCSSLVDNKPVSKPETKFIFRCRGPQGAYSFKKPA